MSSLMYRIHTCMYLSTAQWNNALDRAERWEHGSARRLFVPEIQTTTCRPDLWLGSEIVFSCLQDDRLCESPGLEALYKRVRGDQTIYIMDNHNYALWCWYDAWCGGEVNHIDQHADLAEPLAYPTATHLATSQSCRDYTVTQTQVWSFVPPALHSGVIRACHQIRSVYALKESLQRPTTILDIDVDFFVGMHNKEREQCYDHIHALWQKATCITIATSPAFMERDDAVSVVDKILTICTD